MKLLSLNTWGGRAGLDKLLAFFKKHEDTDIFCLQEIWSGGEEMIDKIAGGKPLEGVTTTLLPDIVATLPDHAMYFHPHFKDYYGLAMFIKNSIPVREVGDLFVYKEQGYISEQDAGNHARNIQHAIVETGNGGRTIINLHGIWNGKGKGDCPERLEQSENILNFTNNLKDPFVFCGDFNLLLETESLKKFEEAGLRNLIREYGITSTRTSYYKKPERHADYVFVNDDIKVKKFEVLPDEVSDHAALLLEFE